MKRNKDQTVKDPVMSHPRADMVEVDEVTTGQRKEAIDEPDNTGSRLSKIKLSISPRCLVCQ